MDDSFNTDLNSTQTAGGSGEAASEQKAEGIVPVFIKQLLDSNDTTFTMWGMRFGMTSCTAIVRAIESFTTKITYLLEDHTGQIEGHYWLEDGDDAPNIMLNNYALVYGSMRSQGQKRLLMIYRLFPISDPNVICTHGLEALNARFKAEEFYKKSMDTYGGNEMSMDVASTGNSTGDNIASGLDSKHRAVFEVIRVDGKGTQGMGLKDLRKKFNHISEKELTGILDFLINEGHIYSSIDSEHFLVTE